MEPQESLAEGGRRVRVRERCEDRAAAERLEAAALRAVNSWGQERGHPQTLGKPQERILPWSLQKVHGLRTP